MNRCNLNKLTFLSQVFSTDLLHEKKKKKFLILKQYNIIKETETLMLGYNEYNFSKISSVNS